MNTRTPRGFIPLVAMIVLGLLALAGGTTAVIVLKGNSAPKQIEATLAASTTPDAPQGNVEANNGAPVSFTDAEVAALEIREYVAAPWAELEAENFALATQQGQTTLTITNGLGETRYYYYFAKIGGWTQAKSAADMTTLAESARVLNDYDASVQQSKAIQALLQAETLKFQLSHPGVGEKKYSAEFRTDSKGDIHYTDSDGNLITCHTDTWGTTHCGSTY